MASIIHRIPMGFMHIGGSPILFSFPGVQTHSFVPLTKIVMVPLAAISATVLSLVTCSGPDRRALVILGSSALSVMSWPPEVESLNSVLSFHCQRQWKAHATFPNLDQNYWPVKPRRPS